MGEIKGKSMCEITTATELGALAVSCFGVRALVGELVEQRRTPPGSDQWRLYVGVHMRGRARRPHC